MTADKRVTQGRPRKMKDPRTVSVVMDGAHRDAVARMMVREGMISVGEAIRALIERHAGARRGGRK